MPRSTTTTTRSGVAVESSALPLASLTPGATWDISQAELCAGGTRQQRQVPAAVRQQVLHDYRMEGVSPDEYELDYLIVPELGGAPDARNLWPERYESGMWNARVKDQLERLLPQLVCSRRLALDVAQRDMAVDWIAAYRKYFRTDAPLLSQASIDDDGDMTYPVWRSTGPALKLISFSPGR